MRTAVRRLCGQASGFLSGVLSKLFGVGDAAVFAHEEKDGEDKAETEEE